MINFTAPFYSEKTGTLNVRAVLPNPNNILLPGQFVRVKIHGAKRPNAIVVPQKAVIQGQEGTFVFVVNAENRAEVRPIEPGPWDQNHWVIYGGLEKGDRVIVDGINKVLPGSSVVIKEAQSSPPKEMPSTISENTGHSGV